jgi:hypothetical protein
MIRFLSAALLAVLATGLGGACRAEGDKDTKAVLDKAIKALGGEEKLSKVKAATWKGKGTIHIDGAANAFTNQVTAQGLDHYRMELDGDFNGVPGKLVVVVNGDKGWQDFGSMKTEYDKGTLAAQKRAIYLQVIPWTLLPLTGKDFKVKAAGEEKVGDKPAVVLKVTPPDGKEFTIALDKDSGLPVKVAGKVIGFGGNEVTQETMLGAYKEFGGIKKATKIESKRDGQKFLEQEISDFKVVEKVDPKTFDEP